jgi:hypothetical protein
MTEGTSFGMLTSWRSLCSEAPVWKGVINTGQPPLSRRVGSDDAAGVSRPLWTRLGQLACR